MSINLYSRVQFVGPVNDYPDLRIGDIGYVIEDYEDGNYEVEFSNPDGSTRVQAVTPGSYLALAES
jgi:hypothetical protein